eukprot:3283148-Pleurochrysis_carterae.AAC.1
MTRAARTRTSRYSGFFRVARAPGRLCQSLVLLSDERPHLHLPGPGVMPLLATLSRASAWRFREDYGERYASCAVVSGADCSGNIILDMPPTSFGAQIRAFDLPAGVEIEVPDDRTGSSAQQFRVWCVRLHADFPALRNDVSCNTTCYQKGTCNTK